MTNTNTVLPPIYSYEELKRLDKAAIQSGIASFTLMEQAGQAAWAYLQTQWPAAKKITVVCGTGNNGGDGFVLATLARKAGLKVTVYQIGEPGPNYSEQAQQARKQCSKKNTIETDLPAICEDDIIVDALLGIGARTPLKPEWQTAIEWMNQQIQPVFALDVPSGLTESVSDIAHPAVVATETLSFIAAKLSFFTPQGFSTTGHWTVADIGIPAHLYENFPPVAQSLEYGWARVQLPPRTPDSHKGDYGHLVVLGSQIQGFEGAGQLAAEAGLRSGAGWVTLAANPQLIPNIHARPELMVRGVAKTKGWQSLAQKASVLVVGPGLGQEKAAKQLWQQAVASDKPMVIDADGLNLLAKQPQHRSNWILTPHPGEAARLLNVTTADIQSNRLDAAQQLVKKFGGIVVLKGAGTLIASETHHPVICPKAIPAMATGGMGDVLAGLIGGLLAQKLSLWHAACLGVIVHAKAAEQFQLERGLLACDLFDPMVNLLN